MKKAFVLPIIFLFLFCRSIALAQTQIKAEVDKAVLSTDEVLTYKLTINSSAKNAPVPKLPAFEGFYIVFQAQSSTISFREKELESSLVYTFILAPVSTGKFKIEPSSVKIEGKAYSSQEFEIEVTQGKMTPKSPPTKPPDNLPESEGGQVTL